MAYRYISGTLKHTKCHLLRFDGNTKPNPGIATSGLLLMSPFLKNTRIALVESGVYHKGQTVDSNVSEYLALKSGLALALKHNIYNLVVEGDSASVIKGIAEGTAKHQKDIIEEIEELLPIFDTLALRHIPRKENKEADTLARAAYEGQETFENILNYLPQPKKKRKREEPEDNLDGSTAAPSTTTKENTKDQETENSTKKQRTKKHGQDQ
jgi:ribonuclease HI